MRSPVPPEETDALGRWDPWRALANRPHIELRVDPVAALMGGAMLVEGAGRTFVVLDPGLEERARRVALAHELVHAERGGGCDAPGQPHAWDAVVAREETTVDAIVAARLVPRAQLQALVERAARGGDLLTAWDVCEAFDVDRRVAEAALADLTRA